MAFSNTMLVGKVAPPTSTAWSIVAGNEVVTFPYRAGTRAITNTSSASSGPYACGYKDATIPFDLYSFTGAYYVYDIANNNIIIPQTMSLNITAGFSYRANIAWTTGNETSASMVTINGANYYTFNTFKLILSPTGFTIQHGTAAGTKPTYWFYRFTSTADVQNYIFQLAGYKIFVKGAATATNLALTSTTHATPANTKYSSTIAAGTDTNAASFTQAKFKDIPIAGAYSEILHFGISHVTTTLTTTPVLVSRNTIWR